MTVTVEFAVATLLGALAGGVSYGRMLLAAGVVGLTIGSVALSWTRWGQGRPLLKCIALAIYAHVLFFCFAYGTAMQFDKSSRGRGDSVLKLNFLADDVPVAAAGAKVWEQPADDSQTPIVETPPLERTDSAPTVDQAAAITKETPPADVTPTPEPARPAPPELIALEKKSEAPPTPLNADEAEPASVASSPPPPPAETAPAAPPEPPPDAAPERLPMLADSPSAPTPSPETPRARPADGQPLPRVYQHRSSEERSRWALLFGGSRESEAAVDAGLEWLARNQAADGRWDADQHGAGREARILGQDRGGAGAEADTGVTGLALLAFLAAGESHLEGPHRENVQHGLEFLLRSQRADGCLAGKAEMFAAMYCHGMAMLALTEALAMTGDQRIRPFVERAVLYTFESQNPTTGGWRYQPRDTGDLSQFGWQLMALKSAEQSGIAIPIRTRDGMRRFLTSVTSGTYQGLAGYRPGERPTRTMTAEALVCRFFLNDVQDAAVKEAVGFVYQELPQARSENLYYWYYATLALFQVQGEAWQRWNAALQEQLLARQRLDDTMAGSWDPDRVWGHYGGRVYSTAMATLCLEVYYRYLPLYGAEVQTARK